MSAIVSTQCIAYANGNLKKKDFDSFMKIFEDDKIQKKDDFDAFKKFSNNHEEH